MAEEAHAPEAEEKRKQRIASIEELYGVLSGIALNDKALDTSRIMATDKLLDRLQGKPTQTVNTNLRRTIADFTDDELAALASGSGGEEGAGEA